MNILKLQQGYLNALYNKFKRIQDIPAQSTNLTKGEIINYIKDQMLYLQLEIVELMVEIGNDDAAILKPWSERHPTIALQKFEPTDRTKSEAIDCLRFCLNICLAAGLTPDNIEQEFDKVWTRSITRLQDNY